MAIHIQSIIKDGKNSLYLTGDCVTTTSTKGVAQKADDSNYYRRTMEVIDGVPTPVTSNSLGTSI